MESSNGFHRRRRERFARYVGLVSIAICARHADAQSATRDLSGYSGPSVQFTVSISIDTPPQTVAVGLEELTPTAWSVSNISDSGTWDIPQQKVKWGPFFNPSVPTVVTYDILPPANVGSARCFDGEVSFDVLAEPVGGDQCIPLNVPAASAWGTIIMALAILTLATVVIRKRQLHSVDLSK